MVQTNYEKLKLEIKSIDQVITERSSSMKNQLSNIEKQIGELQSKSKDLEKQIEEKKVDIQQINSKNDTVQSSISEINNELAEKEKKSASNKEEISEISTKVENTENEVKTEEEKLSNNTKQLDDLTSKIKAINEALDNSEKLYDEKVKPIEDERKLLERKNETDLLQYKILRKLIHDGYVKDSRYDVLKVLKQPGVDTIDKLILSSGVDADTVRNTLNQLQKREIVTVDEAANTFAIKNNFEL